MKKTRFVNETGFAKVPSGHGLRLHNKSDPRRSRGEADPREEGGAQGGQVESLGIDIHSIKELI